MNINMEYKIGEQINFNGITLKVTKDTNDCKGCYFDTKKEYCKRPSTFCECSDYMRDDCTNIIFKQINI